MTIGVPETSGPTIVGTTDSTSTAPTGATADQTSAKAIIDQFFQIMGLQSLGGWAWQKILAGDTPEQIQTEATTTDEWNTRFPAYAQLAKEGRAVSAASYIAYENAIRSISQRYGLPPGMYDTPDQIAQGLLRSVSPQEADFRASRAAEAAYTAPASVQQAFANRVGVANTRNALIAAYLDDTRAIPLLEQQYSAANVEGAAYDAGVPGAAGMADTLAARGITYAQALQGYGQVADTAGLGAGFGETVATETRAKAAFGDAAATQAEQRVQRSRLAAFGSSGSLAESQGGVSGLGPSRT